MKYQNNRDKAAVGKRGPGGGYKLRMALHLGLAWDATAGLSAAGIGALSAVNLSFMRVSNGAMYSPNRSFAHSLMSEFSWLRLIAAMSPGKLLAGCLPLFWVQRIS